MSSDDDDSKVGELTSENDSSIPSKPTPADTQDKSSEVEGADRPTEEPAPKKGAGKSGKKNPILADWEVYGLPAFVTLMTPWQNKITSMEIISTYFQPNLNIATSIIAPLSCFFGYAYLHGKDIAKRKQRMIALWSFLIFILSIIICFSFNIFMSSVTIAFIGRALWVIWIVVYLGIFISFGIGIMAMMVLNRRH